MSSLREIVDEELRRQLGLEGDDDKVLAFDDTQLIGGHDEGEAGRIPAEQITTWLQLSLEQCIDAGIATPEQIAEYERQQDERRAAWMRRPLRERIRISAAIRWHSWRSRQMDRLHARLFPGHARAEEREGEW